MGDAEQKRAMCPLCRGEFRLPTLTERVSGKCPRCGEAITIDIDGSVLPAIAIHNRAQINSVEEMDSAFSGGNDLQDANRVASENVSTPKIGLSTFSTKKEAEEARDDWKAMFPKVDPAYVASGKVPPQGFVLLIIGCLVSSVMAVIVGTIVLYLAVWASVGTLDLYEFVGSAFGLLSCGLLIAVVFVALGGFIATMVSAGLTVSLTLHAFSRAGKNRSEAALMVFALVSCLLTAGICFQLDDFFDELLPQFPSSISSQAAPEPEEKFEDIEESTHLDVLILILLIPLGLLIVSALAMASIRFEGDRFCEKCNRFMESYFLSSLSFKGLKRVAQTLQDQEIVQIEKIFSDASLKGTCCRPSLYACENCGRGFLDLWATFSGKWEDPKNKNKTKELEEEWVLGSMALDADRSTHLVRISQSQNRSA